MKENVNGMAAQSLHATNVLVGIDEAAPATEAVRCEAPVAAV